MNQNKISFEEENLDVDYIVFSISGYYDPQPFAKYCCKKIGFNSTLTSTKSFERETLFYKRSHRYNVLFRRLEFDPAKKQFWSGTRIIFSGPAAAYFYKFIKQNKIDWRSFQLESANITRLDIAYFRPNETGETLQQIDQFLQSSFQKVKNDSTRRKADYASSKAKDEKDLILRVGSRKSNKYYRIYLKEKILEKGIFEEIVKGLQFELEIKNTAIKAVQHLFLTHQFEEFEDAITRQFFQQTKSILSSDSVFSHWLLKHLRRLRKTPQKNYGLLVDYLKRKENLLLADRQWIFQFHQFLTFLRKFPKVKQNISDQGYFLIQFYVKDFIVFLRAKPNSTHQRQKTLTFLRSLQKLPPIIEEFSDSRFRSSLIFPVLKLEKQKRSWVMEIAVCEQLYHHKYPFLLNYYLLHYSNKVELLVKHEIIYALSSEGRRKIIPTKEFFDKFPKVRNQKITEAKTLFIQLIDQLIQDHFIQANIEVHFKDHSKEQQTVSNLTSSLITQSSKLILIEQL